jgi:hypothetical protein
VAAPAERVASRTPVGGFQTAVPIGRPLPMLRNIVPLDSSPATVDSPQSATCSDRPRRPPRWVMVLPNSIPSGSCSGSS